MSSESEEEELELDLDISEVCLRCTLDNRSMQSWRSIPSSEFRFQGGGWKLIYSYAGLYYLHLRRCSGVSPDPFHVSVEVESSGTGRIASDLSRVTRFTNEFQQPLFHLIWRKREEEMLRALPEFRPSGVLKLVVVLKLGGPSPGRAIDSCVSLTAKLLHCITSFCEDYRKLLAMKSDACLSSLSQDLSKLLDQIPEPDVEFRCSGQSMRAHGVVLSARSEVIASLLASDTVDVEGRTKVIQIPNMFPDVFQHFLRYIYSGQLPELTVELALRLYEVGDRYAVKGLTKRCSTFLLEHLSVVNACDVLVVANDHGDRDFKESVVRFMVDKKVPKEYSSWMEFCGGNPTLAVEVLNRFCNVVSQSPAGLQQKA